MPQPNESTIFNARFWQNAVMALVCLSFISANVLPSGASFLLWSKSPESMMIFMGLGVGMKMTKDVVDNYNNKKLIIRGSTKNVDPPE